ncbi:MAG: amidohydrolase, partial [Candidatus Aminicenantes bacterium]
MLATTKSIPFFLFFAVLLTVFGCQQQAPAEKVDLVLLNGNIVTMSDELPGAQALAIKGNKIISVGTKKDVDPFIGEETKIIDLDQKTVIPGL